MQFCWEQHCLTSSKPTTFIRWKTFSRSNASNNRHHHNPIWTYPTQNGWRIWKRWMQRRIKMKWIYWDSNHFRIFSVNFGGQLKVWNIASEKVGNTRPFEKEISDEPVKCLEVFRRQEGNIIPFWINYFPLDVFVLTGGQDQALLLSKFESQKGREKSKANLIPKIAFRGHQRSVECLAVNKEGTVLQ